MNETIKSILERRSTRAYEPKQIDEVDLRLILDAGKFAPSANNRQPWHFTVIQNKQLIERIVEKCRQLILASGNEAMAERAKNPDFHSFHRAPTVIVVSGDESNRFANGDCANTMQNMALAAHSLGLGSCYVASFLIAFGGPNGESLARELGIPEGYKPFFSLAVGYRAAADGMPAPRKEGCVNYIR
jgi:nitroreductase